MFSRFILASACVAAGFEPAASASPVPEAPPAAALSAGEAGDPSAADSSGRLSAGPAESPRARNGMHLGVSLGAAVLNGAVLHDVLQDASIAEQAIDLDVQDQTFGLRLELNTQESSERHYHINSDYQSLGVRLAPTYLLLPPDALVNVLLFVGGSFNWNTVYLDDGIQILESSSNVAGAFGGADIVFHVLESFEVHLRAEISYQRVYFAQFSSRHSLVERSGLFGGSYAF